MKTVLAEKPSVAKDIARVLGANEKKDGYMEGSGWRVTWAFGHLVSLAQPSEYGDKYKTWDRATLPIIPSEFIYLPSDEKGHVHQLSVIRKLFKEATEIVCATDAGREGEAIFRYIYNETGCNKPFKRLWISSLTDSAIRDGFANLKDGREYDNLYLSAKARNEADWLVGLNATRALTIASGAHSALSLGRVQTPTLSLVCERYNESEHFKPVPYFTAYLTLEGGGRTFKAFYPDRFDRKDDASALLSRVASIVTVLTKTTERKKEKAPLPFDITSLQAEANRRYKFGAQKTLDLVQSLYEKHKMLTYPRTGSRYLGDDMVDEVKKHISSLSDSHLGREASDAIRYIGENGVNTAPFDSAKLTDHHAIIPTFQNTGNVSSLTEDERKIFVMVSLQTLMALLPPCEKDCLRYEFQADPADKTFHASGSKIVKAGWRMVTLGDDDAEGDSDDEENQSLPDLQEGSAANVKGKDIKECMTKRPPLLTEATLLKAMESAGRKVEDEELSEAMKECGLGTPATRAAIIETLYTRKYMICEKNKLIPTELGLQVYNLTRNQMIGDVAMTGSWERKLNLIAQGKVDVLSFSGEIEELTRELTKRLLLVGAGVSSSSSSVSRLKCPLCGKPLTENAKAYGCSGYADGCKFTLWKAIGGKTITEKHLQQLIENGQTEIIKGMKSKEGKVFDAAIAWDKDAERLKYVFAEKESGDIVGKCPKCGSAVVERQKGCFCSNKECDYVIWKNQFGKDIPVAAIKTLLEGKTTPVIKGFKSKTGKTYDAALMLDEEKKVKLHFK